MKIESQRVFWAMALNLLLALAINVFLVGCAQSPEGKERGSRNFYYEVRQAANQPRGRFYFIHGMGQSIADLKQGEWKRMADSMHAQDLEVVYIGWDFIDASDMGNQGRDYVARFQHWIVQLNTILQHDRPMNKTFIGGASMGGWHSVIASEVIQADAVYASQVVTQLNVLWPFVGADTSGADLSSRLTPNNFFVSAGTSDVTIAWWNTQALYGTLPNYHEYQGHSHGPYQDEYDDMINWLTSQI